MGDNEGLAPASAADQLAVLKTIDHDDDDHEFGKSPNLLSSAASQESTRDMLGAHNNSDLDAHTLESINKQNSSLDDLKTSGNPDTYHVNHTESGLSQMKRVASRTQMVLLDAEASSNVGTDTLPEVKSYHGVESAQQLMYEQKVEDVLGIEHLPAVHVDEPISSAQLLVQDGTPEEPEPEAVHFAPVVVAAQEQSWTAHSDEVVSPIPGIISNASLEARSSPKLIPLAPQEPKVTVVDGTGAVAVPGPTVNTSGNSKPRKSNLARDSSTPVDISEDGKSRDFVSHGGKSPGAETRFEFHVRVGHYGIQGRRMTMEDQHTQLLHPEFNRASGFEDNVPRSFFAVSSIAGYVEFLPFSGVRWSRWSILCSILQPLCS
jgi:hypothetical protein